jgi:hypothetical protein
MAADPTSLPVLIVSGRSIHPHGFLSCGVKRRQVSQATATLAGQAADIAGRGLPGVLDYLSEPGAS